MRVVIRGAGDLASGIAVRLVRARMQVVMLDVAHPTAVRRTVAFSEAIRLGTTTVEDIEAIHVNTPDEAWAVAETGRVAVLVDPDARWIAELSPDAVVDAILAKKNLGTTLDMAPIVVGVGPGFEAPLDCDACVETARGHDLGRAIYEGSPTPNTGVPGNIGGYTVERVLRAPATGSFEPRVAIGDVVQAGAVVATVDGEPVVAQIAGVVRGLLPEGTPVTPGFKAGDIDPRAKVSHCWTVSDKARSVAGGVLEALLHGPSTARIDPSIER